MKARKFLIVGVFSFLFSNFLFSQTTLHGTIVNSKTGEIIAGARIVLEGTYQGALTDANGQYRLTTNQLGQSTFVVSAMGYESQEIVLNLEGNEILRDIFLAELSYTSDEVVISSLRANHFTPTTFTNITGAQVGKINFGQDLPYLLNLTPSVVVTSDAGTGVGYTGMRIRGVDPTRTNVTVNGIPINDSESHGTFWVNMPDFASSINSVQIQRGVGTSSNGAAAFGASINIKTNEINSVPYGEITSSLGSFNTIKNTVRLGTGIIKRRFTFDARLSKINSDGYIDRASSYLKSYYLSGAWLGEKSVLRAIMFSGKEITYQAWYGTPQSVIQGNEDSINAFADRNGLTYEQHQSLLNSGRTYNYYTYKNEVDNYQQDHYQLHFTHLFINQMDLNISAHYTRGFGYYEQYRKDDDFNTYSIDTLFTSVDTIVNGDFIRRRWLDNHFYGTVFSLQYKKYKFLNLTLGGAANQYLGKHFGEIIWSEFASNSSIGHRYYENDAVKTDISSYLKSTYTLKKITFYGDVQYRFIDYSFIGPDQVNGEIVETNQQVKYHFVNPKAGLTYSINDNHQLYLSGAIANREPVRDDFINSTSGSRPKHETLYNIESGWKLRSRRFMTGATVYYMNYKNQLILTGAINDVGAYSRTNVPESYRLGVELEGAMKLGKRFSLAANAGLSQNKISSFTEYYDDYDNGGQVAIPHSNTDLAFSPNMILAGALEYNYKGLIATFTSKYVSRQFLDNTSNTYRSINPFHVANLNIQYSVKTLVCKELSLGLQLNNLFNSLYENNGYTYSYYSGGSTTTENFYYPQAGFHWMGRLVISI